MGCLFPGSTGGVGSFSAVNIEQKSDKFCEDLLASDTAEGGIDYDARVDGLDAPCKSKNASLVSHQSRNRGKMEGGLSAFGMGLF